MKVLGIIPSRYHSTRLPGKPLLEIQGRSLVMRVVDQCKQVRGLDKLVVATDDDRIYQHVSQNGGEVLMTALHHESGTERCFEVWQKIGKDFDRVINIQGDEPFIAPQQIEQLIQLMSENTEIGTLYKRISEPQDLFDPSVPKIALGENGEALYFSRSTIPHLRGVPEEAWISKESHYKHIGIYGYRSDILATIAKLQPSMIERMEQLEQLRWLAHGLKIRAVETMYETISVDTQDDLDRARLHFGRQ